eukprot:CAMPEP_0117444792 /NCGR_PEP_ID=MMETSP0759-20121206/5440_1 /TAXON_ID=63605 /ORGANISM="Percolomonas cosmopolitus, Strain WS" /LENGTH=210 /DNA_ID=CAMNT_0005236903 /DNA_START=173 /DNA_END=803 /DNA_ORIENTATION=-
MRGNSLSCCFVCEQRKDGVLLECTRENHCQCTLGCMDVENLVKVASEEYLQLKTWCDEQEFSLFVWIMGLVVTGISGASDLDSSTNLGPHKVEFPFCAIFRSSGFLTSYLFKGGGKCIHLVHNPGNVFLLFGSCRIGVKISSLCLENDNDPGTSPCVQFLCFLRRKMGKVSVWSTKVAASWQSQIEEEEKVRKRTVESRSTLRSGDVTVW